MEGGSPGVKERAGRERPALHSPPTVHINAQSKKVMETYERL